MLEDDRYIQEFLAKQRRRLTPGPDRTNALRIPSLM